MHIFECPPETHILEALAVVSSLSLSLLLIDSSYMCISLYVSGLFSFLAFVWSDDIWKMEHTSAVLTKRYSELLS